MLAFFRPASKAVLFGVFVVVQSPALSDTQLLITQCLDAIERKDAAAVERGAFLVSKRFSIPTDQVERAKTCIQAHHGDELVFDPVNSRFYPKEELASILLDRANQKSAAEIKRKNRELAGAELRKRKERRTQVVTATVKACDTLYKRDQVAALTSPVCNPIFMEAGLPD